jgi:prepilin-type N-terminal cleavage/methylation domain-containing protein
VDFERGFTLVEIIMVMVILTVLAVVAFVRSADVVGMRAGVAANGVAEDLRYAQRTAASKNLRTWVVFNSNADVYRLYEGERRASRTLMVHPLTRQGYVVRLDEGEYSGVEILSVDFRGRREVSFDSMGTPFDRRGRRLTADGTVTLTGPVDVTVNRDTGIVKVER